MPQVSQQWKILQLNQCSETSTIWSNQFFIFYPATSTTWCCTDVVDKYLLKRVTANQNAHALAHFLGIRFFF